MLISTAHRENELRERRQDIEQWMSHRKLPEDMRERIRRYEQYDWQEKRGVDEESIIRNLPRDLRRDIKRHLYLKLLMRVSASTGYAYLHFLRFLKILLVKILIVLNLSSFRFFLIYVIYFPIGSHI